MRKLVVIVAVAAAAFTGPIRGQSRTDPTLDKQAAEFSAAFNAKDAAKLASFYTEDASLMPPNQPMVKGRPNIEAYWKAAFEQGLTNLQLKPFESMIAGNQAFEVGTATVTLKSGGSSMTLTGVGGSGKPVTDTAKYVVIFRRTNDSWKMAYDIFNSDLPAQPPPK
jgi:uncharacterized protein (TIGR02246 family)